MTTSQLFLQDLTTELIKKIDALGTGDQNCVRIAFCPTPPDVLTVERSGSGFEVNFSSVHGGSYCKQFKSSKDAARFVSKESRKLTAG